MLVVVDVQLVVGADHLPVGVAVDAANPQKGGALHRGDAVLGAVGVVGDVIADVAAGDHHVGDDPVQGAAIACQYGRERSSTRRNWEPTSKNGLASTMMGHITLQVDHDGHLQV